MFDIHWRPSSKEWVALVRKWTGVFVLKRIFHIHDTTWNKWLQTPGGLREPNARPFLFKDDLKEGYYWPELIH